MTALELQDTAEPGATAAPTFGRLMNTELRRLTARRFTRVIVGLSVLGYVTAMLVMFFNYARVTPEDIAQATAQRDEQIVQFQQYVEQCKAQPGQDPNQCGFVPTADEFPIDQFLTNEPFQPDDVPIFALAVGAAVALAGFIIGATFIGAEWTSKNIVAWLFYEPRRWRLMAAKLIVLCAVMLLLAVLAQVIWLVSAQLLMHFRGLPVSSLDPPQPDFWSDAVHVQLRSALLVIPATLLGFGLANLIRNTAAALGVAFVFFVIVENLMRAFSPNLQPYQFTTSVAAWVVKGGITVYGNVQFNAELGYVMPEEIHISNTQGGVTLMVYAGVVLAISLVLFRRRDIT